jgi:predicted TIM-barrel fold metal-dependent hydrolase
LKSNGKLTINALDIPEKNKEMIFSENAIKLYKLK